MTGPAPQAAALTLPREAHRSHLESDSNAGSPQVCGEFRALASFPVPAPPPFLLDDALSEGRGKPRKGREDQEQPLPPEGRRGDS